MDILDSFLEHIYGNSQSLLYFYITLGFFALFLIIIVLLLLFTSENRRYRKSNKLQDNDKKDIDSSLSKTQNFNNILDKKEEIKVEDNKMVEESKGFEVENNKEDSMEDIKDNTEIIYEDENVYLERELPKEENKETVEVKEIDYTIEMPKVKPMDIDDYLFRKQDENKKEESKEEIKTIEKVELTNDELKNRLAKLKAKKEVKKQDQDLDDLMKAIGLDNDNTSLDHEEEKQILGK